MVAGLFHCLAQGGQIEDIGGPLPYPAPFLDADPDCDVVNPAPLNQRVAAKPRSLPAVVRPLFLPECPGQDLFQDGQQLVLLSWPVTYPHAAYAHRHHRMACGNTVVHYSQVPLMGGSSCRIARSRKRIAPVKGFFTIWVINPLQSSSRFQPGLQNRTVAELT